MTDNLKAKFDDYAAYHTNATNRLTHYIGIPFIALSLIGLLTMVPVGSFNLGWALCGLAFIFYYLIDSKIALIFLPVLILMYWVGTQLGLYALIALQIVGWISQYIGHYAYEKKSPAFYKNIQHVLIGPLWIFAKLIRYK